MNPKFYLNSKPISQGLAVHHLANAMPTRSLMQIRGIVQNAINGNKSAIKRINEYGVSLS